MRAKAIREVSLLCLQRGGYRIFRYVACRSYELIIFCIVMGIIWDFTTPVSLALLPYFILSLMIVSLHAEGRRTKGSKFGLTTPICNPGIRAYVHLVSRSLLHSHVPFNPPSHVSIQIAFLVIPANYLPRTPVGVNELIQLGCFIFFLNNQCDKNLYTRACLGGDGTFPRFFFMFGFVVSVWVCMYLFPEFWLWSSWSPNFSTIYWM